jgi:hypothetical protein
MQKRIRNNERGGRIGKRRNKEIKK